MGRSSTRTRIDRNQLSSVTIVNISDIELVLTRPDVGSVNGRELPMIYLHARENESRILRFVTPIPCPGSHSLFTKRTVDPRDPSCRESSIHRSGSLSYTDNLPEVSRACQSFLASSRQDFTHYARRPFETQSIHRSAKGGMCRGKLTFARAARPPLRDESAFRHTCVLQATYFL